MIKHWYQRALLSGIIDYWSFYQYRPLDTVKKKYRLFAVRKYEHTQEFLDTVCVKRTHEYDGILYFVVKI